MRVLVYPHAMEIGGSQLNAIQLADAVRRLGHAVSVISRPGPLVERVRALGLDHVEIPESHRHPGPASIALLAQTVRRRRIDVVHGYEWPPVIEACFGPRWRRRTPVLGTVLSMSVVPFFPRSVPLVVGTEQIRDAALANACERVTVIEPPVDTDSDSPDVRGDAFRAEHGVGADEVLVAMVCRLVPELKLEGLLAAADAVGELARDGHRMRLMIVGDGRARNQVAERAAAANARAGRQAVTLIGSLDEPRPAYAAADVLLGQGGSALRGMSFGKPLVVVGEDGFNELLTPETAPLFLRQGWYGRGAGSRGAGAPGIGRALDALASSHELRRELGAFSRRLVVERFALSRAAKLLEEEYGAAVAVRGRARRAPLELVRCGAGVANSKVRGKYRRWRATATVDDANARPVCSAQRT